MNSTVLLGVLMIPGPREDNPAIGLLGASLKNEGTRLESVDQLKFRMLFGAWIKHKPRTLHFHWPESLCQASLLNACLNVLGFLASIGWFKIRGTRLVWTVHNLFPHENRHPRLTLWMHRRLGRWVHQIIAMTSTSATMIQNEFEVERQKISVIPHGSYRDRFPSPVSKSVARQRMGIDEEQLVFIFFGQLRPYKGLDSLLDQFELLGELKTTLLIAGKWVRKDSLLEEKISSACERLGDRIRFCPEFLPDSKLEEWIRASDVCVFPFNEVHNSGSVHLAMTLERPVVIPSLGSLKEFERAEFAFVYNREEPLALKRALKCVVDRRTDLARLGLLAGAESQQVSSSQIAKQHIQVYDSLNT